VRRLIVDDPAPITPAAGTLALPRGAEAVRVVCERYRVAVRTVATGRRSVSLLQSPGGTVLLADARRMSTAAFYAVLEASGYRLDRVTVRTREEGLPLRVDLAAARGSWSP